MAAVAAEQALHTDGISPEVELVHLLETQVIGREDVFIHHDFLCLESPSLDRADPEPSVLLVLREEEFSGYGAEPVGFQRSRFQFLAFRVVQPHDYALTFLECSQALTHVAAVEHRLVFHGLSRIVGRLVREDVAVLGSILPIRPFVPAMLVQVKLPGLAEESVGIPEGCLKVVDSPLLDSLHYYLRDRSEAIHRYPFRLRHGGTGPEQL